MPKPAVRRLKEAGFTDSQISLIGHRHADGEPGTDSEVADDAAGGAAVGGTLGAGAGLLAGLGLMAIPGIGPGRRGRLARLDSGGRSHRRDRRAAPPAA